MSHRVKTLIKTFLFIIIVFLLFVADFSSLFPLRLKLSALIHCRFCSVVMAVKRPFMRTQYQVLGTTVLHVCAVRLCACQLPTCLLLRCLAVQAWVHPCWLGCARTSGMAM